MNPVNSIHHTEQTYSPIVLCLISKNSYGLARVLRGIGLDGLGLDGLALDGIGLDGIDGFGLTLLRHLARLRESTKRNCSLQRLEPMWLHMCLCFASSRCNVCFQIISTDVLA